MNLHDKFSHLLMMKYFDGNYDTLRIERKSNKYGGFANGTAHNMLESQKSSQKNSGDIFSTAWKILTR